MTPTTNHLFEMNEMAQKISKYDAQIFHTIVTKLLFLRKWAQPDILIGVEFVTTRVRGLDEDDKKKLIRVLKYIHRAHDLVPNLESDGSGTVKWWVDASVAVQQDMKSHNGGEMLMGKGEVYSALSKHKLNTKSSTEAELVGVDDLMPQILWMRYFWRLKA